MWRINISNAFFVVVWDVEMSVELPEKNILQMTKYIFAVSLERFSDLSVLL